MSTRYRSSRPFEAVRGPLPPPTEFLRPLWSAAVSLGLVAVFLAITGPAWLAILGILAYLVVSGTALYRLFKQPPSSFSRWADTLPCYLVMLDEHLNILDSNRLTTEHFGEGHGRTCYAVLKHRTQPCPDCSARSAMASGEPQTKEDILVTRQGKAIHVLNTATPLTGRGGNVVGAIEMAVDITETHRLRQELEQSKKHFQQLFNSVPCYITVQDRSLRIIESNDWFRKDFGDAVGKRCHEVYKRHDKACDHCPVLAAFEDGEVHCSEETVSTGSGDPISLIVYSMPIRDEHGDITAVMEVSTNITEVKQLQRRLAMVGMAVAEMAHRIKNILMGLEGGIYVVNTGLEANDQALVAEGWEMVQRNVSRVSRITKDLLRASKERTPSIQPDVSPAEIARDVYGLFHDRAAAEGIRLELEVDDAPFHGNFDEAGLHNMLSNLVSNAIDACRFDPEGGRKAHRVRIACHRQAGDAVCFEVEDNGAGIPEETSERIYERFFSTKGLQGTGLGLLIVQQIVEEHHGRIQIDTEEGKGTTFRIVIPSQALPPDPQDTQPDNPKEEKGNAQESTGRG